MLWYKVPDVKVEHGPIIDISPVISKTLAVFPGDTPFEAEFLLDMHKGDHLTLSTMKATVHLGAHADAPSHYSRDGETMESRRLYPYLGEVQVIEVQLPRGERIRPSDLAEEIRSSRVLLKTQSFPNPNQWNDDFNALSAELVDYLAASGVCLIGIDTPSVDLAQCKKLESHQRLAHHNLAVLEGLVLEKVTPGLYSLIALPLKIQGSDASPVRAVLLPHRYQF